jgi:hypothetical protein
MRTIPESALKYCASPPHTPAIFLSVAERINRFGPGGCGVPTSVCRVPQ